jgi:hypothetical protein
MEQTQRPCLVELENSGFVMLPNVFGMEEVNGIARDLGVALSRNQDATMRGQSGIVYAARNVLSLWPAAAHVWRIPLLPDFLAEALGTKFGLVRALYFDKPPDQTWALPWHKDLTIAVRDNQRPSDLFGKPTRKAGVPHVEAPLEVLKGMLTVRIHLDAASEENGALRVIPGSHRDGKAMSLGSVPALTLHADPGDVLLIRPLVTHCSNRSQPDTCRHRRILHLEFAASRKLPDGYEWHDFIPGGSDVTPAPSPNRRPSSL